MFNAVVEEKLSRLTSISLEEMEKVRLMNRIDTKYITLPENLNVFLTKIEGDYYVQEVNGKRLQTYQTLYFDTPDLQMFIRHHNGHKQREKIRLRNYVGSDLAFLEIKDKNNKGQTLKTRLQLPEYKMYNDENTILFLETNAQFTIDSIMPHVETCYDRITLVDKGKTERLTIDINLAFNNTRTGNSHSLAEIVIIELKQEVSSFSPTRSLLSSLHIYPVNVSKYCIGSVMTDPGIKHNRFKPKIIRINKLIQSQKWNHLQVC
ncbi:MAG: polyphosphate polymerase domain-containing protein [Mangrovibacterium sp.]